MHSIIQVSNFALTPSSVPATDIIAKVESAVRPLDAERADIVRRSVNTIFQQAEPPTPSITKGQQEALNSLKEDRVLLGDKSCASVILHADTYHAKTLTLIDAGSYQSTWGNRVTYAGEDQRTR